MMGPITSTTVQAAARRGVSLAEEVMIELRDQTPESERSHGRTISNSVKMLKMINEYFNNNEDVARTWSDETIRSVAKEMASSEAIGPRNYQGEPVYIDLVRNAYVDELANACRYIVDRVLDGLDSSCLFVEAGGMEQIAMAAISDKLPVCWGHMTYGHPILTLVKQVAHFNHQHHARHTQFYSADSSSDAELLSVRGYKLYKWPQSFVDISVGILRDSTASREDKWHNVGTLMSLLATALRDSSSSLHEETVECFAELLRVMVVETDFLTDLLYAVNSQLSPSERSDREAQREKDRAAVKTAATNLQQRHMASLAAELSAHRTRLSLPPGGPHAADQFNFQFNVCMQQMKDRLASPDYSIALDTALTCWLSARVLLSQISRVVNYPHRTLSRSRGQPRAAPEAAQGDSGVMRVTVSIQSRHCALLLGMMGRKMLETALLPYPDLDDKVTMDPTGGHHNIHLMADVVELLCKVHVEDRHHMIRSLCLDAFYKLGGADLLMDILLSSLNMLQQEGNTSSISADGASLVLSETVQHVLWWFERTTSVKRLHNAAITAELSRPNQSLGPYVKEEQKAKMRPLLEFNTIGLVSSLQYTFAASFVSKWRDDSVIECIPAKAAASLLKALTHVLEPDRSLLRAGSRPSSPEDASSRDRNSTGNEEARVPMSTPHQPTARRPPAAPPQLSEVESTNSPQQQSSTVEEARDGVAGEETTAGDEGSPNPIEEEDNRRADEYIEDMAGALEEKGGEWKPYADKEDVIACSKDVASDVMSRALVLGEKGRTQSISAQTHIADVCVRLTGNKLIKLGPEDEGVPGEDLGKHNCRHIARVCLNAVVDEKSTEGIIRIAAHVLCCLTHANASVVSGQITDMGVDGFGNKLIRLLRIGGDGDVEPRDVIVDGYKIAPFSKPLRKREPTGAVVGDASPSSVAEELANMTVTDEIKARMPPKWLSTVLVCTHKWLGCLATLSGDLMLSLTKALVRMAEMKPIMDPMQSQALLMCLVETSRYYDCAVEILNSGGLWVLLTLPQISSYPGMLAHLKAIMLNICRDDDYIVEVEAKPYIMRYLVGHSSTSTGKPSEDRPWVKAREVIEGLGEKIAQNCVGRDIGKIVEKSLKKYTRYVDWEGTLWITLKDDLIREAKEMAGEERRTSESRPQDPRGEDEEDAVIPENLSRVISTLLVALRVCMVGRGIGPAMTTSSSHYQANEEIAYAAAGPAKLANGAEQMLFLISKLCQGVKAKHILPKLKFEPAIPERFRVDRGEDETSSEGGEDCFTWMAENTGSCLLDFIGDGLYALSAVSGDQETQHQASLWAGAMAQEWLFVAVLNSGRSEAVVEEVSGVLWRGLSSAFADDDKKDNSCAPPKVDVYLPQRGSDENSKRRVEGEAAAAAVEAARASRLMAAAYLIYSMQLTKCSDKDGKDHYVLDGRMSLPGSEEVESYHTMRVDAIKSWLGEALAKLNLERPYSPFVAESVLEPLVLLTRSPEFPDGASAAPQRGTRRAGSVGESSANSSLRHENVDVPEDDSTAEPTTIVAPDREIHVEIVTELDGEPGDEGQGPGADSVIDDEEADRSSVDDAMDVAPLEGTERDIPSSDPSPPPPAPEASGSSEQPSEDDDDEEEEEELFEPSGEFIGDENPLLDIPTWIDEIEEMDYEDAVVGLLEEEEDDEDEDSFFHIGGSDEDDAPLPGRGMRALPRAGGRGVVATDAGGGTEVRWISAAGPPGGGSSSSQRVFSIFDSAVREMSQGGGGGARRMRRVSFDGIEPLWSFDVQAPGEHPLISRSHTGTSLSQLQPPPPAVAGEGQARAVWLPGAPGRIPGRLIESLPQARVDVDGMMAGLQGIVDEVPREEIVVQAAEPQAEAVEMEDNSPEELTEVSMPEEAAATSQESEEGEEELRSSEEGHEGVPVVEEQPISDELEEPPEEAASGESHAAVEEAAAPAVTLEEVAGAAPEIPALMAAAERLGVEPSALLDATGIDATVLEALPADMHEDIIREHVGQIDNATLRRLQQQHPGRAGTNSRADGEQQQEEGEVAQEQEGMDNATFLATLTDPTLREEILVTASPQFLETLPAEVRAEARALRDRAGAMRIGAMAAAARRAPPAAVTRGGAGAVHRRGQHQQPPQHPLAPTAMPVRPDSNRVRIRLGSGWQGAPPDATAPDPGQRVFNLPTGDVADLLDLTSQFASRAGGAGGPPVGGQSRALVNLLFDVLQRSETTGGRHWVDSGGRIVDASQSRGGHLLGGRGPYSLRRASGGVGKSEEQTAISERRCHLYDKYEVPPPMPAEFVDTLLRLLWMRYLPPGLKAKLDEITHHLCLHRALRSRLFSSAMRMLLQLLRGAETVMIDDRRPETKMSCTALLGEPSRSPFTKAETPSVDDPAIVRSTMASRLLVAIEFIVSWVPSSREWLTHQVHSVTSSSSSQDPTGIDVLMDTVSSPLLDVSPATLGNLVLLLSKLLVPSRPKATALLREDGANTDQAAREKQRVEKSIQRSRVLMQHVSAESAKRLMEHVFGPSSGDLLHRRSHPTRMDPRYDISADVDLMNPFAMERMMHKGIAVVVALAESDSHGAQLRADLAAELSRLAEAIVALLEEPADAKDANDKLQREGQRLMRFVGAYKQVARNKCRHLSAQECDTAYRNTLAEYLSGSASNPGLLDLWKALDGALAPYDDIDMRQTEGQRQLEALRAREAGDVGAMPESPSTSSVDGEEDNEEEAPSSSTETSPVEEPSQPDAASAADSDDNNRIPIRLHRIMGLLEAFMSAFGTWTGADAQEGDKRRYSVASSSSSSSAAGAVDDGSPTAGSPRPLSRETARSSSSASLSAVSEASMSPYERDISKLVRFLEKHKRPVNACIKRPTDSLSRMLMNIIRIAPHVVDFDNKRAFFHWELNNRGTRIGARPIRLNIRRNHVFMDSFHQLRPRTAEEMRGKLSIVFSGEEAVDAGGVVREWFGILSREIFNPNYALFSTAGGNCSTFHPNSMSYANPDHLAFFEFCGRFIGKAIYDNQRLACYFTRSFYKHMLGKPVSWHDMESEDPDFYKQMLWILDTDLNSPEGAAVAADMNFTTDLDDFGRIRSVELKPNGSNIRVTEENKKEYVHLVCQHKMTQAVRPQLDAFLKGFNELIPSDLLGRMFDDRELELLISGLPTIDVEDWKENTLYSNYTKDSDQIIWFWSVVEEFSQQQLAMFLQFVTGSSQVPLEGFKALQGMRGPQKMSIHRAYGADRLPTAHTCMNQLDLPNYGDRETLKAKLVLAINEAHEGFGFV